MTRDIRQDGEEPQAQRNDPSPASFPQDVCVKLRRGLWVMRTEFPSLGELENTCLP